MPPLTRRDFAVIPVMYAFYGRIAVNGSIFLKTSASYYIHPSAAWIPLCCGTQSGWLDEIDEALLQLLEASTRLSDAILPERLKFKLHAK